jgi:hypothetical protein
VVSERYINFLVRFGTVKRTAVVCRLASFLNFYCSFSGNYREVYHKTIKIPLKDHKCTEHITKILLIDSYVETTESVEGSLPSILFEHAGQDHRKCWGQVVGSNHISSCFPVLDGHTHCRYLQGMLINLPSSITLNVKGLWYAPLYITSLVMKELDLMCDGGDCWV